MPLAFISQRWPARLRIGAVWLSLGMAACSGESTLPVVSPPPPSDGSAPYCLNYNALRNPYFGDLHVHTTYSLDANTQGTLTTPHDAYRFALGERVGLQPYDASGNPTRSAQLPRPLDFTAVTDHAELLGETEICTNPDAVGYNSPECLFYRQSPDTAFTVFNFFGPGTPGLPGLGGEQVPRLPYCGLGGERCLEAAKTPWRDIQRAAEAYYDRSRECRFTTFVGYEYTAAPLSNNLHRNVIFASEVVPERPPAYQEYPAIELLWQALAEQCRTAEGCNVLTIPHNSNLSAGLMFQTRDNAGRDYTADFAARRQLNEPLAEIYQHKGQSECLNTMGAGSLDELCGFEVLPYNNLTGDRFGGLNTGPPMEQDFLREALKEGLRLEGMVGVNPFKYGFIGSTDTHLSTPGNAVEENFPGHAGAGLNPRTEVTGLTDVIEVSPGGLAVLWAEQNTRESLFSAMRRREAYGTSGPRMQLRFFGGWDYPANLCGSASLVQQGYARGVPMGGDLPAAPAPNRAPQFVVSALRDPGAEGDRSEPLQRVQIIKGWVDASGAKQEQVFEVAGDANNGASVDTSTCETQGPGFASLCSVWQDPDFNPAQSAFYYARVVQNPSCRWATHQCNAAGVNCAVPDDVPPGFEGCCDSRYPKSIQERAWSSPIWYRPPAAATNATATP